MAFSPLSYCYYPSNIGLIAIERLSHHIRHRICVVGNLPDGNSSLMRIYAQLCYGSQYSIGKQKAREYEAPSGVP